MGQIIIEIPLDLSRTYRIVSAAAAKKLLENLERITVKENPEENEDILSLWTAPEPLAKKNAV